MTLYAESSAVLAWLLGEPAGAGVAAELRRADVVMVSDLLFVECHRTCVRAEHLGAFATEHAAAVRSRLDTVAQQWTSMRLSPQVLERSRQPFPVEPIRSLDALHLSSALRAQSKLPGIALLSLDQRIRDNASRLGFRVLPG